MKYTHKIVKDTTDTTEIEVTVEFKELEPYREAAYKDLAKDVKIQGFRPGKAPRHLIEPKIASNLVNESVGRLLQTASFKVMADEDFRPILQPDFDLKQMDPEKGITFTFTFTNYPKVELGDFSKIKVEKESVDITDEEVETVIKSIVRSNIKPARLKELTEVTEKAPKAKAKSEGKSEDTAEPIIEDFKLNDEIIAELGYEKEKTLKVVMDQVREQLTGMKEGQNEEAYMDALVLEAVKLSKFDIPKIMIDNEVDSARASFDARLAEIDLDKDTYLATQGKKFEDLEKEWNEAAEKRVGVDLVLVSVTMNEDKMPTDKDVDKELSMITDPAQKTKFSTPNGRDYVRMVLARRVGIDLLKKQVEGGSKKNGKKAVKKSETSKTKKEAKK